MPRHIGIVQRFLDTLESSNASLHTPPRVCAKVRTRLGTNRKRIALMLPKAVTRTRFLLAATFSLLIFIASAAPVNSREIAVEAIWEKLRVAALEHHKAAEETIKTSTAVLPAQYGAWSASAANQVVNAFEAPDPTSKNVGSFPAVNVFGHDPTTFGVYEEKIDASGQRWLRVQLPPAGLIAPPNGTQAWISASTVTIVGQTEMLVADLSDRTLTRFKNGQPVGQWQVGIGKPSAQTPTGDFFLWSKWTPDQGSHPAYGNGVLAVSARSNQLESWQGASPLIGIHGTNRASDLGREVSHGCIRMSNDAIQTLLAELPLGVPVQIVA